MYGPNIDGKLLVSHEDFKALQEAQLSVTRAKSLIRRGRIEEGMAALTDALAEMGEPLDGMAEQYQEQQ